MASKNPYLVGGRAARAQIAQFRAQLHDKLQKFTTGCPMQVAALREHLAKDYVATAGKHGVTDATGEDLFADERFSKRATNAGNAECRLNKRMERLRTEPKIRGARRGNKRFRKLRADELEAQRKIPKTPKPAKAKKAVVAKAPSAPKGRRRAAGGGRKKGAKRGAAPVSSKRGAAPVSSKRGAAPVSSKRGAAPVSSKRGAAPVSSKRSAAPVSSKRGAAAAGFNEALFLATLGEGGGEQLLRVWHAARDRIIAYAQATNQMTTAGMGFAMQKWVDDNMDEAVGLMGPGAEEEVPTSSVRPSGRQAAPSSRGRATPSRRGSGRAPRSKRAVGSAEAAADDGPQATSSPGSAPLSALAWLTNDVLRDEYQAAHRTGASPVRAWQVPGGGEALLMGDHLAVAHEGRILVSDGVELSDSQCIARHLIRNSTPETAPFSFSNVA